jgi:hypothetical protein
MKLPAPNTSTLLLLKEPLMIAPDRTLSWLSALYPDW